MLVENSGAVSRLTEIHEHLTGRTRGRKHGVEVLNKSAIVLLVACWESFIEQLAVNAFDAIYKSAKVPDVFPIRVLVIAGSELRESQDATQIWKLAGNGWRQVLAAHRQRVLDKYVGKLNTPKPQQINDLFLDLIGIKNITKCWMYPGASHSKAENRVTALVTLRGDIAHKVQTATPVKKADVEQFTRLIARLAGLTSNYVGLFIENQVKVKPWRTDIKYDPN